MLKNQLVGEIYLILGLYKIFKLSPFEVRIY